MRLLLYQIIIILLLCTLYSCSESDNLSYNKEVRNDVVKKDTNFIITSEGNKIPTGIPIPAIGKKINPDSISKPRRIQIKKKPKSIPITSNIHSVGKPKVVQLTNPPKKVAIDTSQLIRVLAKGKTVPAIQPKPTIALPSRFKDKSTHNIQYLDVDQGMNSSYVYAVLQDRRNNLWFGTLNGLTRYDGNSFTHFTTKEGLSYNVVDAMLEDSQGYIWLGTRSGVNCYDGKTFTHFTTQEGLSNNEILSILEDSKGNFWFGTRGGGVNYYDGKTFTHFTTEEGLGDNWVHTIFEDSKGRLWFGTNNGINRYDGKTFTHFTTKEGLGNNEVLAIMEDSQGNFWFGTESGVSKYDGKKITQFTTKEGLSGNQVRAILEDSEGHLWFGTNNGTNRYDGKTFTHFTTKEGLSNNRVYAILEDNQGNFWFGTDSGVNRYDGQSFTHSNPKEGLNNNEVISIIKDSQGHFWLGGRGNGLTYNDGKSFTHFTTEEGLDNNNVWTILENSQGNLWFGTYKGGITYYDGKSFTHYTTKEGLSNNFVWSMLEDNQGNLWFATNGGGITKYNGKYFTHYSTKEGLSNNKVLSILEDSQGILWFGTHGGGVIHYDGDNFTHFTTHEGLSNDRVVSIFEDSQGMLWFGTDGGGINQYDGKSFTHYTTKEGLSNNEIWTIHEDKKRNIWLSTQKGISVLSPVYHKDFSDSTSKIRNYQIFTYVKEDGLKRLDFGAQSTLDDNQLIQWGNNEGLTNLNLNNFKLPRDTPSVSLKTININQEFVDFNGLLEDELRNTLSFGEALSSSFDSVPAFKNYPINLSLPYDLNHLTFQFSAIDWSAPHKLKYSYYIEGLDNDWTTPNVENKADYRNLPYGTFTFKVKAIGAAKKWSKPFEYTFTINPPWWLTWWAKCLYTFSLLGILYQARQYERKQQQRKLDAKERVNKATSKFVPMAFLNSLGRKDIMEVKLGDAVEQEVTVMFSDIRDYTTLSENMTPEDTFQFVNAFNKRMGPVIINNKGFVNQYLGDAIMALFKAHPKDALQAAIQMQHTLLEYNTQRVAKNLLPIRMGIGLHTGSLIMGIIGDNQRMDAATISDAVNTASRIESLSKYFKANILLSEESLNQITQLQKNSNDNIIISNFNVRFLGKVQLKGKKEPIGIYECFDGDAPETIAKKLDSQILFKEGMDCYLSKQFKEATIAFDKVLAINEDDQTASLFHQKSIHFSISGVTEDWTGIEIMSFK